GTESWVSLKYECLSDFFCYRCGRRGHGRDSCTNEGITKSTDVMVEEEKPVGPYFIKMKNYVAQLECLGYVLPQDLGVSLILNGLTSDFAVFVRNYNKHNIGKTIGELHALLIEYEKGLPKKAVTPQVMVIQCGRIQKANKKSLNAKGKEHPTQDDTCHHCKEVGHCKRNCPAYLAELIKKKKQVGTASCLDIFALESAARILNMVPTNKGCEPFVKWDTLDKLQQRSVKCIFIGYPKETMGYYFYFPPVNKIVVARHTEFLEKNLISQEVSGKALELEEIQDEDTSPSENTSEIPVEVEGFEPPQEEVIPVGRSWLDAMNVETQSMKDNQVWCLVDLPPNCKSVASKWIFKKKTDMDRNVHTYKAHLVAKDFPQTYEVSYEETFPPIADIRAIRILIAIAAFYDYEIWQMDSYLGKCLTMKDLGKTAFIFGIKIYQDRSKRLIRLSQSAYMDKILKRYRMDNSKRGNILMQEGLDLNKRQDASTPREVKHMQNVPYASANPREPHWTAVKTILKYLRNTKYMFLVYGRNPEVELRVDCYCNAGFETERDETKSQTGYVFILNGRRSRLEKLQEKYYCIVRYRI
nr:hypothetical protein [Tanacetum cinerariifolium]